MWKTSFETQMTLVAMRGGGAGGSDGGSYRCREGVFCGVLTIGFCPARNSELSGKVLLISFRRVVVLCHVCEPQ